MTIAIPRPSVRLEHTPDAHCTGPGCTATDTVWLSPDVGRRCADCPPWLDAPRPFVALRAHLARETRERFDEAAARWTS